MNINCKNILGMTIHSSNFERYIIFVFLGELYDGCVLDEKYVADFRIC